MYQDTGGDQVNTHMVCSCTCMSMYYIYIYIYIYIYLYICYIYIYIYFKQLNKTGKLITSRLKKTKEI